MRTLTSLALGTVAAAAGGIGYASLIERNAFTLRRWTLPVLPPEAPPLRILHVSDLHLVPRQRRKMDWVRGLAALEPDFVVNTGDNLADQEAVPAVVEAFEPLLELPGMFVMGSNDYFGPVLKNPLRYLNPDRRRDTGEARPLPTEDLVKAFLDAGWQDLNNRRGRLDVRGLDLELVGVDDPHIRYDRYATVAGPADPDAALTLGVVHAPYQRVLDAMTADGAGLVIAGHTHGGQLCVPFHGALVSNCDLPTGQAQGVSRWWPGAGTGPSSPAPEDAAWLEVSAGLGTSPYAPVRFACRPEASLLTLIPRRDR